MKKRSYELPMLNREYKDTIFRWIFSIIENLLSLYNAVTVQIPLHRITDSASNGSVFPVVTEHFSASSDHAFL